MHHPKKCPQQTDPRMGLAPGARLRVVPVTVGTDTVQVSPVASGSGSRGFGNERDFMTPSSGTPPPHCELLELRLQGAEDQPVSPYTLSLLMAEQGLP